MNFRKDDIDTQLRHYDNGPSGVYNQLNWKVRTGVDATQIMSQVVSVHEFMHNELNNTSAYGFLLQSYAYLARENTPAQAHFNNILHVLVERCRTAHEVYATWTSIALLSTDTNDHLYRTLLEDSEEYLYYYIWAAQIVQSVPDLYLRRHIVVAIINICFQSRPITEAAAADLIAFDPDALNKNEFPDQRLILITQHYIHTDWMDMLQAFTETQQLHSWYGLLRDALAGKGDESVLSLAENESNSVALITFIYDKVATKLESLGLLSLPYLEHLPFFKQLLPLLDKLAPFSQSANPLTINTQPEDITRSTLQNFENESQLFTDRPLTCILLHPSDISDATKAQILGGTGEHPHIFVTGRTYFFMREQYIFPIKEDAAWCEGNGSFTAIRYAGFVKGQRIVIYVPFSNPEEMSIFLNSKPAGVPVLAAISETARYDANWWNQWGNVFATYCTTACLLLDISPLYYIEKVFPGDAELLYGKMDIKMEEQVKSCLLFQVKHSDQTMALIVAPCGEIYARALHHYIETRYHSFRNKIDLAGEHLRNIPTILSHIFREEHQHYFRSQLS